MRLDEPLLAAGSQLDPPPHVMQMSSCVSLALNMKILTLLLLHKGTLLCAGYIRERYHSGAALNMLNRLTLT